MYLYYLFATKSFVLIFMYVIFMNTSYILCNSSNILSYYIVTFYIYIYAFGSHFYPLTIMYIF